MEKVSPWCELCVPSMCGMPSSILSSQILVIKKFRDVEVTRKFMELTTWLVEVRDS